MNQTRFRTGIALMALGGVAYIAAFAASSNPLFAIAVALFGLGLLVHLTDPVMYDNWLVVVGLGLAVVSCLVDAVLTATDHTGTPTAIAFAGIVVGLVVGAGARYLAKR